MKKWLSFLMALTLALGMTSFASAEQVETIEVAYMLTMNAAEQRDMVQEELNRLLDEKGAGFHVNLVCIVVHPSELDADGWQRGLVQLQLYACHVGASR